MPRSDQLIVLNVELPAGVVERVRASAPGYRVIESAQAHAEAHWIREAEVLVTHHLPPEVLLANQQLRWIQTPGAGIEWLLTPEVRQRRELTITNASGVHGQPIAEHVFGFILMFARRLHIARSRQPQGKWQPARGESLRSLAGATLGILGVGAIGRRCAEIGQAFGMRVIGLRRGGEPVAGIERMYRPEELHACLAECDYVLNALPLTAATRGLFDDAAFAAMRRDAFFVNIGRGGTVQGPALLRALREQRIAGVGLDVTDPEPLPSDDPLWQFENAIITPHYAGGRPDYMQQVAEIFLDNLARYVAGRPLVNVVDKDAGY